jgi:SpoVK/Ycf46/Vps4 family AAA+-type ATPase
MQETEAQVTMAMTANSVKNLPVEFINRMDERFFFDMPSEEERLDILKIHLLKAGQDSSKFNLASLAEKARNMVGREIEQAIGAAMIDSFEAGKEALDEKILGDQLAGKPRIYKTMADELKEVLDWVGWDEDAQDGVRARLASARRSESFKLIKAEGT